MSFVIDIDSQLWMRVIRTVEIFWSTMTLHVTKESIVDIIIVLGCLYYQKQLL